MSSASPITALTQFEQTVTCCICLDILKEPVKICSHDHFIDLKCLTKLVERSNACPLCQANIQRPFVVSRFAQNVVDHYNQLKKAESQGLQNTHEVAVQNGDFMIGTNAFARSRIGGLIDAVKQGNEDLIKDFLQNTPNINQPDAEGKTAIVYAKNNSVIKMLLAAGAKIYPHPVIGNDVKNLELLRAVREGNLAQVIDLLVQGSANVNSPLTNEGKTALHTAVEIGNSTLVLLLLRAGAELEVKTIAGETPLHRATFPIINDQMMTMLLLAGAQVDIHDLLGKTPLCNVARRSPNAVQLLLEAGADVNLSRTNGATPLHYAAKSEDESKGFDTVKLLIAAGAKLDIKNLSGETALQSAQRQGNKTIAALLEAEEKARASFLQRVRSVFAKFSNIFSAFATGSHQNQ